MSNLIRMTSLVATVAGLALSASQAAAAPVAATADASARARILTPLTLNSTQNFDLGDIVLSGAAPFTATVKLSQAGVRTCPVTVTCSGTPTVAKYEVTGTKNVSVNIVAQDVTLTGSNGGSLTLKMADSSAVKYYPVSVPLGATGVAAFSLGGEITIADTTTDGVYTGTFNVTAEY